MLVPGELRRNECDGVIARVESAGLARYLGSLALPIVDVSHFRLLPQRSRWGMPMMTQLPDSLMPLQLAKELLGETELTLADVAERCGFEHADYFRVVFKRHEGVTPGAWRSISLSGGHLLLGIS